MTGPTPVLETRPHAVPRIQVLAAVLWPSFLCAGAASAVFFTVLDPVDVLACPTVPPWSRMAAYSVGFLGFWLLAAFSSALSTYFLRPTARR